MREREWGWMVAVTVAALVVGGLLVALWLWACREPVEPVLPTGTYTPLAPSVTASVRPSEAASATVEPTATVGATWTLEPTWTATATSEPTWTVTGPAEMPAVPGTATGPAEMPAVPGTATGPAGMPALPVTGGDGVEAGMRLVVNLVFWGLVLAVGGLVVRRVSGGKRGR